MKASFASLVAGVVLLAPAAALAHHSFAAEYDVKKPVTLKGVVTKVEWTNPHARFYIDVKDESGKVTNWNLELASPNVLVRQGWNRHSLKDRRPRMDRTWPMPGRSRWPMAGRYSRSRPPTILRRLRPRRSRIHSLEGEPA
jgi:Family of unknown function (DUF6152)